MNAQFDSTLAHAETLLQNGDYPAAFSAYSRLLTEHLTSDAAPTGRIAWTLTQRTASLAQLLGQFDLASTLLENLDKQFRHTDSYAADYAALQRIIVLLAADRIDAAYHALQALAPTFGDITTISISPTGLTAWERGVQWSNTMDADRAAIFALFYRASAGILSAFGQYRQSLTMSARGLGHAAQMRDTALSADYTRLIELDRTAALIEMGDFAAAETALNYLEADLENAMLGYHLRWRELRAQLALLRGEFGTATADYRALAALCQQAKLLRASLLARLNLVGVLIILNQTALARAHLTHIENLAAGLHERGIAERCHLLQTVIDARSQLDHAGDPVSAQQGYTASPSEEALPPYQHTFEARPASFLAAFDDRVLDIQFMLARADLTRAAESGAALRKAFGKTDSSLVQARLNGIDGLIAYYQGQIDAAKSLTEEAYRELERVGARSEAYQTLRVYGWCLARSGAPPDTLTAHQRSMQAALEALSATLTPHEQEIYLLNKWTEEEAELAFTAQRLLTRQAEVDAVPAFRRWWARLSLVRDLRDFMHRLDRRREDQQVPLGFSLRELSTAVIGFVVLPDRTITLTRTWLNARIEVLPLPRLRLRDEVRQLHEALSGGRISTRAIFLLDDLPEPHADPPESRAHQLAQSLRLRELVSRFPRPALVIVPDDALHGVPFSTLLIDTPYTVSHQFFARPRQSHKIQTLFSAASAAGNERFAPLPGTAQELSEIGAWAQEKQIAVTDLRDLTPSALAQQLPECDLAHIACHGIFTPDDPDATGLVLISSTGAPAQIVSLPAVRKLTLSRIEHLVLSACWSADYYALPGRRVLSLPESFLGAGVGTVLASLWEIEDAVAVAFMRRYYHYLESLPYTEALVRTQHDARHNQLGIPLDTSAMRQWASFQLYGSQNRLWL